LAVHEAGVVNVSSATAAMPMWSGAIYWSGIGRMVFACSETRLGAIAGIGLNVPRRAVLETGARIVTVVGPTNLEDEAAEVHQEFCPKHLSKAENQTWRECGDVVRLRRRHTRAGRGGFRCATTRWRRGSGL